MKQRTDMTERERNQTLNCKDCNEVFKRLDAALLPNSGGWKTVACPRCKGTSITQFHHEVFPTRRPGYRNR